MKIIIANPLIPFSALALGFTALMAFFLATSPEPRLQDKSLVDAEDPTFHAIGKYSRATERFSEALTEIQPMLKKAAEHARESDESADTTPARVIASASAWDEWTSANDLRRHEVELDRAVRWDTPELQAMKHLLTLQRDRTSHSDEKTRFTTDALDAIDANPKAAFAKIEETVAGRGLQRLADRSYLLALGERTALEAPERESLKKLVMAELTQPSKDQTDTVEKANLLSLYLRLEPSKEARASLAERLKNDREFAELNGIFAEAAILSANANSPQIQD
jgi:hypothetical protein